eukprot:XP_025979403.1 probable UDP-N-acetylglucosamine--peptide N-acetylglucosaminyltransferase SPINDLY [Glycine max]
MDDSHMLTLVIQEMSKEFPTFMESLVHERDQYVEELVRLPDNFHCCTPSPKAGPVCLTPALCNGFVTFGSFNNLAKLHPRYYKFGQRYYVQFQILFLCLNVNYFAMIV